MSTVLILVWLGAVPAALLLGLAVLLVLARQAVRSLRRIERELVFGNGNDDPDDGDGERSTVLPFTGRAA